MPEATDQQMQTYGDQRIRTFAESWRALVNSARDDKASIDDVYARASGSNAWADSRTDPPHLLQAGNSANPDDFLNFNQFISSLIGIVDGTGSDATNAANLRAAYAVLNRACVRPV